MTPEIHQAVLDECKALLTDGVGTVILKTNFKSAELATYTMPLLLLDILPGEETKQLLGGAKWVEWGFAMNSYTYSPDAYGNDTTGFATGLKQIIDDITDHFCLRNWLTPGMSIIEEDYGFRFTLSGIHHADALEAQDGLINGYRTLFDSVAIDDGTDSVQTSTSVLENVVQIGSVALNEENVGYTQIINALLNMPNTEVTIPANTFVNAISMTATQGTPTLRIGTTEGADDIMTDTVIGVFKLQETEIYCPVETIFYFTMTDGIVNTRLDVTRNYFSS